MTPRWLGKVRGLGPHRRQKFPPEWLDWEGWIEASANLELDELAEASPLRAGLSLALFLSGSFPNSPSRTSRSWEHSRFHFHCSFFTLFFWLLQMWMGPLDILSFTLVGKALQGALLLERGNPFFSLWWIIVRSHVSADTFTHESEPRGAEWGTEAG